MVEDAKAFLEHVAHRDGMLLVLDTLNWDMQAVIDLAEAAGYTITPDQFQAAVDELSSTLLADRYARTRKPSVQAPFPDETRLLP
jgi:hypothetical protein